MANFIPGINVGNAFKQLGSYVGLAPKADYDIFDGWTLGNTSASRAGQRNLANGTYVASRPTDNRQNNPASPNNENRDTVQDIVSQYPGDYYGGGSAAKAEAERKAEEERQKQFTIGQINNQIAEYEARFGNIDKALSSGYNTLEDSYNKGLSRLNEQYGGAMSKFATQRGDTKDSFVRGSEDNQGNARNNYQALMQMLGRAGAGRSSAAQNLVPYAVSQSASKAQGELSDTYGRNLRDLKTAEDETTGSYNNSKRDLGDQRNTNRKSLETDIGNQRSQTEQAIAALKGQRTLAEGGNWQQAQAQMSPHAERVRQLNSEVAGLADKYRNPYAVKDVQIKKAELQNYALDPNGVKISDPNGSGTDTDTSADYLARIREEEKRKQAAL